MKSKPSETIINGHSYDNEKLVETILAGFRILDKEVRSEMAKKAYKAKIKRNS